MSRHRRAEANRARKWNDQCANDPMTSEWPMTDEPTGKADSEPWEDERQKDGMEYLQREGTHFELKEEMGASAGENKPSELPFDLEERTAKFGEAIIRCVKEMPLNATTSRIIDQLVGCGTSVGGNYCEADEAVSKKEFINKIGTCKEEAKETKFFLRMAATAEPSLKDEARELWREAKELHLIFSKIFRSSRGKE